MKIKSFVVIKINEGQLVVISSDEEDEVILQQRSPNQRKVL